MFDGWLRERLAAPTTALSIRVADGEASTLQPVLELELRALEHLLARRVDHDLHAVVLDLEVVARDLGVEEHLVAEAGAAARTDRHAEHQRFALLLSGDQALH